jgi:hypothetical protein
MQIIELDASKWTTPLDFLNAVRRASGAPKEHGLDIDTIVDSMVRGGINSVQPPYTIRIVGTAMVDSTIKKEIETFAQIIKDARLWCTNHRHGDLEVAIEIAS